MRVLFHQDKGSPVSPGQCFCTHVCRALAAVHDWLWTGWSPSIFSWFGTIWLFSVPQHEKKTLGWEAGSDWWWGRICSSGLFRGSGWELPYQRNPNAATPMEEVCGLQGRLCWDHCIIVSLCTFQPTLVVLYIMYIEHESTLFIWVCLVKHFTLLFQWFTHTEFPLTPRSSAPPTPKTPDVNPLDHEVFRDRLEKTKSPGFSYSFRSMFGDQQEPSAQVDQTVNILFESQPQLS